MLIFQNWDVASGLLYVSLKHSVGLISFSSHIKHENSDIFRVIYCCNKKGPETTIVFQIVWLSVDWCPGATFPITFSKFSWIDMQGKDSIWHCCHHFPSLRRDIICNNNFAPLNIDHDEIACSIPGQLAMRDDLVFDSKRQNNSKFFGSHCVKVDDSLFRLVLHIDKMFSIEVERNTVLVETEAFWWMLNKHVLIKVWYANRC